MTRRILALGAVVVLVALGGLVLTLHRDESPSVTTQRDEAARAEPTTQRDEALPISDESNSDRPQLSAGDAAPLRTGPESNVREYAVGDVLIRDHRAREVPPPDVPPAVHPPIGRRLPSRLTSDLAAQLRAATTTCAASVPADARGAAPRIDGEIVIAIKDQRASITSATIQPRDLTGDAMEAVKQCLLGKAIGMSTPSGDEPDLEQYSITLSLVVL
jgi:hypothetical protein